RMRGMLHDILVSRFGRPTISPNGRETWIWNSADEPRRCKLYRLTNKTVQIDQAIAGFYGDFAGASLLQGALKVAVVDGEAIWGLPLIGDLQGSPILRRPKALANKIVYIMDAANLWYYGVKDGQLYCFDGQFDELDRLGPVGQSVNQLID